MAQSWLCGSQIAVKKKKLQSLTCSFKKIELYCGCFLKNGTKIFRTASLQNFSGELLLNFSTVIYCWIFNRLYAAMFDCAYISRTVWVENKNEIVMFTLEHEMWMKATVQLTAGQRNCKELKRMVNWADDQSLRVMFVKEISFFLVYRSCCAITFWLGMVNFRKIFQA